MFSILSRAGCWVVSVEFINNSSAVGQWLEEDQHEFSMKDQPEEVQELVSAYKRWHWRVNTCKEFPFTDWKVALLLGPEKLEKLRR